MDLDVKMKAVVFGATMLLVSERNFFVMKNKSLVYYYSHPSGQNR